MQIFAKNYKGVYGKVSVFAHHFLHFFAFFAKCCKVLFRHANPQKNVGLLINLSIKFNQKID